MDLDSQLSHTTVPRLSLHTWNLSQSKGTDVTKPQVDLFEGTLAILWLHTCPAHCLLPICSRSKKWKWFKDQETQLNSYFSETLAKQKPPKISSIFCFICSLASNQVTFFEVSPTDLSKKNIWKWWVKGLFETILLSVQIKTPEKKEKCQDLKALKRKNDVISSFLCEIYVHRLFYEVLLRTHISIVSQWSVLLIIRKAHKDPWATC